MPHHTEQVRWGFNYINMNNKEYYKNYYKKNRKKENLRAKKWYIKNRKKIREKAKLRRPQKRKYERITALTTKNKKISGIIKRNYPIDNKCEICEKSFNWLAYHHWDDNDLQKGKFIKGIWVCRKCHLFITIGENQSNYIKYYKKQIEPKYLNLKKEINLLKVGRLN
jgi:hypothetical protein